MDSRVFRWLFNMSMRITTLDLADNEIEGHIPEAFGNLILLKYLNLSRNRFGGGVPKSFRNLSHLNTLLLPYNYLGEPISETFTSLPKGENTKLKILDLSSNNFTGSMPGLGEFVSLKEIHLCSNALNGLPGASIQKLSEFEVIDVSFNSIEGTIKEDHLSQLHNLKVLDLSYNSIAIKINPSWIPPFQLEVLRLACCEMETAFPKWIQSQKNTSYLDISGAGIVDVVPEWLWDLSPRLQYLNLSYNQISGRVADFSSNLVGFPTIDLSSNIFSGPLPLFHPNSSTLLLSSNMFQGPISSICRITYNHLGMLDLSGNQLSGGLPECWMNMKMLRILNLANNFFSGKIPHTLCSSDLLILHLQNNNLSNELPSNLMNCKKLRMLDVGENSLRGIIPSWIGTHLTELTVLILRHNKFDGNIPPNICHLDQIQMLDLSRNSISGQIPKCFNNFSSMVQKSRTFQSTLHAATVHYLNDYHYKVDAYIDSAIVQWKRKESEYRKILGLLKLIDLSSSRLTGSIPQELCHLEALISLNLSGNSLIGKIDPDIGHMEMLESLDLSNNQISGEIPMGLASLSKLAVLNLSNNNLSGRIPSGTQLQGFNASVYAGNSELCGHPLSLCPSDNPSPPTVDYDRESRNSDDAIMMREYYISMAVGLIVGFWGVIATLFFK